MDMHWNGSKIVGSFQKWGCHKQKLCVSNVPRIPVIWNIRRDPRFILVKKKHVGKSHKIGFAVICSVLA